MRRNGDGKKRTLALFRFPHFAQKEAASLLVFLLLGISFPTASHSAEFGESGRPNLLFISIDTLRADHIGCYGYQRDTTPNIDKLASDGVLFTDCTAVSSWTVPTHMTMFTGLYPSFHRVTDYGKRLPDGITTLAQILKEKGYATAAFVTGPSLSHKLGFDRGFDLYDDYTTTLDSALNLFENQDDGGRGINEVITSPITTRLAIQWLEREEEKVRKWEGEKVRDLPLSQVKERGHERPFFLFVHYWDLHYDYIPPAPYDKMFDPDYRGLMDGRNIAHRTDIVRGMPQADLEHLIALYDGEIRFTDYHVGLLLRKLEELKLDDDTVVLLTSDHGEEFLEHGGTRHGHTLYQELVHVALIIRLARSKPREGFEPSQGSAHLDARYEQARGKKFNVLASHVDILPTVVDFLGIESKVPVHGMSLAPFILGSEQGASSRRLAAYATERRLAAYATEGMRSRCVFSEVDRESNLIKCIRRGGLKFILGLRSDGQLACRLIGKGRKEAYDLKSDPREVENLRQKQGLAHLKQTGRSKVIADLSFMEGELFRWIDSTPSFGRKKSDNRTKGPSISDKELLRKLRALGYVQ